jgi:hypothetical protein
LLQQAWILGSKALTDSLNAMRRAREARQNPNVAAGNAPARAAVPPP